MNNEMINNANDEIVETIKRMKRDYSILPKAEKVSIHVDGNVVDGENVRANAFIIMVRCNGQWRSENDWLHRYGIKTPRRVYADTKKNGVIVSKGIDKARAAKEEIKNKWGVAVEKKAPKGKTAAEKVAAMSDDQKREWFEILKASMAAA